ncbi:kinase-like protein [Auricularia subglabra TFB-10046 SS5]|nr:kinase-like protein [Auricularia subglabra TFB-10046 SS5]
MSDVINRLPGSESLAVLPAGSSDASGLQYADIIKISPFQGSDPLTIRVLSGVTAKGGTSSILKGAIEMRGSPRVVAIKAILNFATGKPSNEQICRELAAVSRVRHPHILPFIGALSTSLYTVVVSEYMESGNMLEYIKAQPTVQREPLLLQVAIAVDYLHTTAGFVHGDLKCENVLISASGDALLADFGLSTTVAKADEEATTATNIRHLNTVRFAAPELLLDEATSASGRIRSKTPQTDVYAFGMLVVQVRRRLFRAMEPNGAAEHIRPSAETALGLTTVNTLSFKASYEALCILVRLVPKRQASPIDGGNSV